MQPLTASVNSSAQALVRVAFIVQFLGVLEIEGVAGGQQFAGDLGGLLQPGDLAASVLQIAGGSVVGTLQASALDQQRDQAGDQGE
ncbi:hypothetical protein ACYKUI_10400 [Pseudomonas aeruginosa]